MINMIKTDARLAPYLRKSISDAGIEVGIDATLSDSDYVAIKIDDYYAGQRIATPPKAVDYIVVVDCQCDWFAMYILELKNVDSPKGLNIADIQEKFGNTINLFLNETFKNIFLNDKFKYKGIKLYLISDAYKESDRFKNHEEFLNFKDKIGKKDTLKVDFSLGQRLYRFRGKILRIQYDIPPNPIIARMP